MPTAPSFKSLDSASVQASKAARGSSKKSGTRCEMSLRRALWRRGCRFRVDVASLPGRPDIVFTRSRLVIFCDGDFWHGKDWQKRKEKLQSGHNAAYWIAKIERNIQRDLQVDNALRDRDWIVLRFWESEIRQDLDGTCDLILQILDSMSHRRSRHVDDPRTSMEE